MPINPSSDENKTEFIQRCMTEEAAAFPNEKQRYAVCISYWERRNLSKTTTEIVMDKIKRIK